MSRLPLSMAAVILALSTCVSRMTLGERRHAERLTMHVSKDPEFPVVALCGAGQMPEPDQDEAEEARLFYVAATRATQRLIVPLSGTGAFGGRLEAARAHAPAGGRQIPVPVGWHRSWSLTTRGAMATLPGRPVGPHVDAMARRCGGRVDRLAAFSLREVV